MLSYFWVIWIRWTIVGWKVTYHWTIILRVLGWLSDIFLIDAKSQRVLLRHRAHFYSFNYLTTYCIPQAWPSITEYDRSNTRLIHYYYHSLISLFRSPRMFISMMFSGCFLTDDWLKLARRYQGCKHDTLTWLILCQCLRRWPNIAPTQAQHVI